MHKQIQIWIRAPEQSDGWNGVTEVGRRCLARVEQCKRSSKSPIMLRRSRSGVRIADFVRVSFCHDNPGSALPGQLVCQIPEARNRKGEGSSSAATFPTKKNSPSQQKKTFPARCESREFPPIKAMVWREMLG